MVFANTPECLVFTQEEEVDDMNKDNKKNKANVLIIGLRDTPYLLYLNCSSLTERRVSLNEKEWDTHASFTPLQLSLSPDKKLLAVATDKSLHFVYLVGSNTRVATLAGHACSDYGRPRCAWDPSSKYVYSNSEDDNLLHVYSIASGRIVASLRGHAGLVKDISCCGVTGVVASVSYDKSLILWKDCSM